MTAINGKTFKATNGKPFIVGGGGGNGVGGKKEQTKMSVAISTVCDVVVFLTVSLGFIFRVSDRICLKKKQ